jgi:hypothetical protein
MYSVCYVKSRALIIGIDDYQHVSPLKYAVNDANAVAELMVRKLGFQKENVLVLTNGEATRSAIYRSFLSFAGKGTDHNDRLVVFFAGHGFTTSSLRGEVGYLVPSDGSPNDLSTLLRWDDLTRNADLIRSKHVLFIMDACYGGLAVTRSFRAGAMRFLSDMMMRTSRQVLTAGKADELVSDLGGPLPNHSVFTGHFLEALSGKAEDNEGNLTANGVIAYVYQAVSSDSTSQQTPHYGYLHGDGDMIFYPLPTEEPENKDAPPNERLVSVPALNTDKDEGMDQQTQLKQLLSERKYRIELHDFMAQRTRELLSLTGQDYFSTQGPVDNRIFVERMHKYEDAVQNTLPAIMLLGRWGENEHLESYCMPIKRLSDRIAPMSGKTYLLESRWYPVFLLMYAGGIGAIAGANYRAIYDLLHTQVPNPYGRTNGDNLLFSTVSAMNAIYDGFKLFPGHEQQHAPRSDYLFKLLQPLADDILFLGTEYEKTFDKMELIMGLEYMQIVHPELIAEDEEVWGPPGRSAWMGRSAIDLLVKEAKAAGDTWPPLVGGLFGGSFERFLQLTGALSRLTAQLRWR